MATVNFIEKTNKYLPSKGNTFLSPFSLIMALEVCKKGAANETLDSISDLLGEDLNPKVSTNENCEFNVANALWLHNTCTLIQEFAKSIDSTVYTLDFQNEDTVNQINEWCSKNTKGKIERILDELSPNSRMVITNAVYFKGKWDSPFNKRQTVDSHFTNENGESTLPFMEQEHKFNHASFDDFSALEMDYIGNNISLVVLLPNEVGTQSIEENLIANYENAINSFQTKKVMVRFPKFELETSYDFRKILSEDYGLLFSNRAEFSKMIQEDTLKIDAISHKATFICDEEGSEAAAVTAVVMATRAFIRPELPVPFIADRPFVFFIRNKETEEILFYGRFSNE